MKRDLRYYWVEPFRRAFRFGLTWWFDLSPWHVASADAKPYVRDVVNFLNQRRPQTVCEVGCGLGDIIRRVSAPRRYGFDSDPRTVRAAKLLAGLTRHRIEYAQCRLGFDMIPSLRADAWILVNWPHMMSPAALREVVGHIFLQHLCGGGCIIIDSVSEGNDNYRHDPYWLCEGLDCAVHVLGTGYQFSRSLYAIEKPVRLERAGSGNPTCVIALSQTDGLEMDGHRSSGAVQAAHDSFLTIPGQRAAFIPGR